MSYLATKRRRDFAASKWQFLAAAVTVIIGVMMFASTYDSYRNLTDSYNQTYDRLAFADMTVTGGDPDMGDVLSAVPGVKSVTVRHQADLPVVIGTETILGRFIGMPPGDQPDVNKIGIESGSYLTDAAQNEAVAEIHVARTFELEAGDVVSIPLGGGSLEIDIVGTASSAEYIWVAKSRQQIFTDPNQFGVFFVDEASVSQLPDTVAVRQTLVLYDDGVDVEATDSAVADAAKGANAADVQTQADQPSNATLSLDVEGFGQMAIAFPVMFLLAAGLTVYVLLTRIVYSQRSTIGTMRASGISAQAIRNHYLGFGLWIGVLGSIIGVAIGLVMGTAMTTLYTGLLDIPDTVIVIRPVTIIVGLLFGLVAGLLSAWVPARGAYRNEPAQSMRGIAPTLKPGVSIGEKLIPPLRSLPVRWRMTMRGMGRSKGRSISTVVGVVLAIVLILASAGMVDTMSTVIDEETTTINLADAIVIMDSEITTESIASINAVPPVTRAEPVATLPASITNNGTNYATNLTGFDQGTQMHGWTNPSGELPKEGILAGAAIASLLDVSEGDMVNVELPTLDVTLRLEIVEFVAENVGTPVYIRTDALISALDDAGVEDARAVVKGPIVSTIDTILDPTLDRETSITALEGVAGVIAVQDTRTFTDLINSFLGLFWAFIGIMVVFGGLMAFALMFSTISVNVSERSTEFATMKASGMSDREIGFMVAGENLFLTALGIVPGLLLGTLVASAFMDSFSSDMLSFPLTIQPRTYALAAVTMIAVAIVSLIPGIRRIRRLDVGEIMRERSV